MNNSTESQIYDVMFIYSKEYKEILENKYKY